MISLAADESLDSMGAREPSRSAMQYLFGSGSAKETPGAGGAAAGGQRWWEEKVVSLTMENLTDTQTAAIVYRFRRG